MQKTGIEYLTHTWNPIAMRCSKCSPGCDGCWHLRTADRLCGNPALPENERAALAGAGPFVLRDRELSAPLSAKKPAVIGVQFMGDLFHEAVPDEFIQAIFGRMDFCGMSLGAERHNILVLTKRPQRMADVLSRIIMNCDVPWERVVSLGDARHIYLGITVCNQTELKEKWRYFAQVPGRKYLSIEPMLGPMRIARYLRDICGLCDKERGGSECDPGSGCLTKMSPKRIDAVILGGETGPGARRLDPEWVRSVRDQCLAAGVPFFFKQWGEWSPSRWEMVGEFVNHTNGHYWWEFDPSCKGEMRRIGKAKAGRHLDGRTHDELPWISK